MTTYDLKRFIENSIPDGMWDLTISDLEEINNTVNKYGLDIEITDNMISHYSNDTLKDFLDIEASK